MISKELKAQIQLLEDPDKQIFSIIRNQIIEKGIVVIPVLESAWDNSLVPLVHDRIENIIHDINFNQIVSGVEAWVQTGRKDWFTILFLLSKFYFQNLKKEEFIDEISEIKNNIWLEINDNLTAFEKVQILNHIIFKKYKFSKNTTHKDSKHNFFISELVNTKKGNDLSLGLLYLLLCESLELSVYGVDLPGNFILAFLDSPMANESDNFENDVLFYINPINNGSVFGMHEIDIYLEKNKLKTTENYYQPSSNTTILIRYINELIEVLKQGGEDSKINELAKIKQLIQ